jgi:small subunit ribosomal protein S16
VGSKKNPIWRVVVADRRSPRDGRFIETIGHYNPQTKPSTIVLDHERLDHWLALGAEPTNTVKKLMRAKDNPQTVEPEPAPEPQATPPREPEPEAEAKPEPAAEAEAEAAPEAEAPDEPKPDEPEPDAS